jgi:hypothetical protein
MLDGMNLGLATGNGRRQAGVCDALGRNVNVDWFGQIDAPKNDACARRRRPQREFNTLPTVQAHTHGLGEGFEGSLSKHGLILNSQTQACIQKALVSHCV